MSKFSSSALLSTSNDELQSTAAVEGSTMKECQGKFIHLNVSEFASCLSAYSVSRI